MKLDTKATTTITATKALEALESLRSCTCISKHCSNCIDAMHAIERSVGELDYMVAAAKHHTHAEPPRVD